MKSEQISVRLGFTFGLLVLMLVTIGWLGLRQMTRINNDLKAVIEEHRGKLQLIRAALNYSDLNSHIVTKLFFSEKDAQTPALLAERTRNTGEISILMHKLETQITSPREKTLFLAVEQTRWLYVNSYLKGLQLLLDENRPVEARTDFVRNTIPLLDRYHRHGKISQISKPLRSPVESRPMPGVTRGPGRWVLRWWCYL